ncbi:Hypothetical predicted protein, partial [Pelobates cultripes]
KKKEAGEQLRDLTQQRADLEQRHKRTQQDQTYRDLITKRRQLTEIIGRKHARQVQRSNAFFYVHANKGGKLLAQMLRGPQNKAQVHTQRTRQGRLMQFPEEIADEFRSFYTKLYNTTDINGDTGTAQKQTETARYLQNFNPDALTLEEAETLDVPVTEEEVKLALKTAKNGKAPSPDVFSGRILQEMAATITVIP